MVLEKLNPGMTVYEVKKSTGLYVWNSGWSTWPVYIKEIDEDKRMVLASWNGNKPEWYREHRWSKWRLKKPHD